MWRFAQFLLLVAALSLSTGCMTIMDEVYPKVMDMSVAALAGETKEERIDRERLETLREQYRNPGAPGGPPGFDGAENESRAREAFRLIYGHEPNLNWHAR